MPTWFLRLFYVVLGIAFILGAMALSVPSIKRGYFLDRHGQPQARDSFAYNFLCVTMFGIVLGGGAFIGGGLTLSREQLLRGPLNNRR